MKSALLLSLVLLVAAPARAGDWEMFPLGQRSYFADSLQTPVPVEMYLVDSVRSIGDVEVHYFNMALLNSMLGTCAGSVVGNWYTQTLLDRDSLILSNDTAHFFTEYGTLPTILLPQAFLGQSWVVQSDYAGNAYDQITVTCSALEQRIFLGITDSVKVFTFQPNGSSPSQTPITGFQMVLSKSHGLVEFVPFELFQFHPYTVNFRSLKLVGIDADGTQAGFHEPGFQDYFHLTAGDVLVWELHNQPVWISDPETYEYYHDSITSSVNTEDSVVYHGIRTYYHADGSVTSGTALLGRYVNPGLNSLLHSGTKDIGTLSTALFGAGADPWRIWHKAPYQRLIDPIYLDTTIVSSFESWGDLLDTTNCFLIEGIDTDDEVDLDTWAGLIRTCNFFNGQGSYCMTIIGSTVGGITKGLITVGIGQAREIDRTALAVYPNPATESIFVDLPSNGTWQYTIIDALGHSLKAGSVGVEGISISELTRGVYMLRIHAGDRVATSRFVKE